MISCTSVGCLSVPAKGLSYGCTKMLAGTGPIWRVDRSDVQDGRLPGQPYKAAVSWAGAVDRSTSKWPSASMVVGLQEGAPKNVCSEKPRQKPQNLFCHILLVKQGSDSRRPGREFTLWWERQGRPEKKYVRWKDMAEAIFAKCSQLHLPTG